MLDLPARECRCASPSRKPAAAIRSTAVLPSHFNRLEILRGVGIANQLVQLALHRSVRIGIFHQVSVWPVSSAVPTLPSGPGSGLLFAIV